jgi:hypothetical protein
MRSLLDPRLLKGYCWRINKGFNPSPVFILVSVRLNALKLLARNLFQGIQRRKSEVSSLRGLTLHEFTNSILKEVGDLNRDDKPYWK